MNGGQVSDYHLLKNDLLIKLVNTHHARRPLPFKQLNGCGVSCSLTHSYCY